MSFTSWIKFIWSSNFQLLSSAVSLPIISFTSLSSREFSSVSKFEMLFMVSRSESFAFFSSTGDLIDIIERSFSSDSFTDWFDSFFDDILEFLDIIEASSKFFILLSPWKSSRTASLASSYKLSKSFLFKWKISSGRNFCSTRPVKRFHNLLRLLPKISTVSSILLMGSTSGLAEASCSTLEILCSIFKLFSIFLSFLSCGKDLFISGSSSDSIKLFLRRIKDTLSISSRTSWSCLLVLFNAFEFMLFKLARFVLNNICSISMTSRSFSSSWWCQSIKDSTCSRRFWSSDSRRRRILKVN